MLDSDRRGNYISPKHRYLLFAELVKSACKKNMIREKASHLPDGILHKNMGHLKTVSRKRNQREIKIDGASVTGSNITPVAKNAAVSSTGRTQGVPLHLLENLYFAVFTVIARHNVDLS